MSGTKLLLDTNIILYLLSGDRTIAEIVNGKQLYISFITELELLSFRGISGKEEEQIHNFLDECVIININEQIKSKAILIRRQLNLKLPDSIIASTSRYLDIPLITADLGFKMIQDVDIILYEVK